jgi:DNA polymerase
MTLAAGIVKPSDRDPEPMKENLYTELHALLSSSPYARGNVIMSRNADEEEILRRWLDSVSSGKPAAAAPETAGAKPADANSPAALKELVEKCSLCGNVSERKPAYGDGSNGVMIILHAPRLIGRVEVQLYRKDSVDMLKAMVRAMQLSFPHCYVTNLIKCEAGDMLMKPSQMVSNCLEIIRKELALVKPSIVIVMGEMQPLQKIIHDSRGMFWFTVEHPITMLKNPDLKKSAWATLKNVMDKIRELEVR